MTKFQASLIMTGYSTVCIVLTVGAFGQCVIDAMNGEWLKAVFFAACAVVATYTEVQWGKSLLRHLLSRTRPLN